MDNGFFFFFFFFFFAFFVCTRTCLSNKTLLLLLMINTMMMMIMFFSRYFCFFVLVLLLLLLLCKVPVLRCGVSAGSVFSLFDMFASKGEGGLFVCWLVGCLTSQQHANVSHGRICTDSFTCCHTEIEVADPTFYLTQSQQTDTGPTSPSTDLIMLGVWQGSHWSPNF